MDNPPRLHRFNQLQALFKAFNLGQLTEFESGNFVKERPVEDYQIIFEQVQKDLQDLGKAVIAAECINNKDAVELLIAKGADVNARDKDGKTPLHETRSLEAAKILIASGASLKARDNQGNTPLHTAAYSEVAQLLVAKGADVKAKNNEGKTPVDVIIQDPCDRSWPSPLVLCDRLG